VSRINSTRRVANCSAWDGMGNRQIFQPPQIVETRNIWVATGHSVHNRVVGVILVLEKGATHTPQFDNFIPIRNSLRRCGIAPSTHQSQTQISIIDHVHFRHIRIARQRTHNLVSGSSERYFLPFELRMISEQVALRLCALCWKPPSKESVTCVGL
jgi:hypothetical protein